MDTAKVARIMLSNPGDVAESAGFDREFLPHPSLFVCMPTTAGTGSEVSEMAVVSLAGSDIKLRYRSQNMTAEVAVLDPELTVTCSAAGHRGVRLRCADPRGRRLRLAPGIPDDGPVHHRRGAAPRPMAAGRLRGAREHRCTRPVPARLDAGRLRVQQHATWARARHRRAVWARSITSLTGSRTLFALPAVTAFNESLSGEEGSVLLAEAFGSASGESEAAAIWPDAASAIASLRERLALDRGLDEVVEHRGGAGNNRRRRPEERQHSRRTRARADPRGRSRCRLRDARAAERNTAGRTAAAFGRRSEDRVPVLRLRDSGWETGAATSSMGRQ